MIPYLRLVTIFSLLQSVLDAVVRPTASGTATYVTR